MNTRFNPQQFEDFLEKQAAADEFSGAILVAKDDEILFKKAYGLASKRFNIPNRIITKFNIGSINKVFTRIGILQLAEKGKIHLSDYIGKYLPNYPSNVASKVNTSHLLNHTSGMGHYWNKEFEALKYKIRTIDAFLNLFKEDPLAFEPGEETKYSNAGYVVLGKIIEEITQEDYYDYVREHIYKPAKMNDSDHYETDIPIPELASGYTRLDEEDQIRKGPRRNNHLIIGVKGSPAGGGYSTIGDMHKFCIALRNHELLGKEYTELAFTRKKSRISKTSKPRIFGHAGGGPGIGSIFEMYLDLCYIVVILSNYDPENMWPVHAEIKNMIISNTSPS
jgi:CubicO group peptidase (beta-lactamase class C family)